MCPQCIQPSGWGIRLVSAKRICIGANLFFSREKESCAYTPPTRQNLKSHPLPRQTWALAPETRPTHCIRGLVMGKGYSWNTAAQRAQPERPTIADCVSIVLFVIVVIHSHMPLLTIPTGIRSLLHLLPLPHSKQWPHSQSSRSSPCDLKEQNPILLIRPSSSSPPVPVPLSLVPSAWGAPQSLDIAYRRGSPHECMHDSAPER